MIFDSGKIHEAAGVFRRTYAGPIDTAVVLGSGLGDSFEKAEILAEIPFTALPYLPVSTVPGHQSLFRIVRMGGKKVLFQYGRIHLYEGHSAFQAAFPAALYGFLGIKNLVLTNAAGGINPDFSIGDVMLIRDHINFQGESPLTGINESTKFQDLSAVYETDILGELLIRFGVKSGVYIGVRGPNYETPAEINAFRILGADAVGMSTVQEAILAKFFGMRIFGFSLIANKAAGMQKTLKHEEVLEAGKAGSRKMSEILEYLLNSI